MYRSFETITKQLSWLEYGYDRGLNKNWILSTVSKNRLQIFNVPSFKTNLKEGHRGPMKMKREGKNKYMH